MIEFYGVRSDECKIERHKRIQKSMRIILISTMIMLCALAFIIFFDNILYAIIMCLLIAIPFIIIIVMPISNAALNYNILTRITIENGQITLIAYQENEVKKINLFQKLKM